MTVHIRCVEPRNTPFGGLQWTRGGQVLPVEDHAVAQELLRIPGFSEVHPDDVALAAQPDSEADSDKAPAKARARKTPVTE